MARQVRIARKANQRHDSCKVYCNVQSFVEHAHCAPKASSTCNMQASDPAEKDLLKEPQRSFNEGQWLFHSDCLLKTRFCDIHQPFACQAYLRKTFTKNVMFVNQLRREHLIPVATPSDILSFCKSCATFGRMVNLHSAPNKLSSKTVAWPFG